MRFAMNPIAIVFITFIAQCFGAAWHTESSRGDNERFEYIEKILAETVRQNEDTAQKMRGLEKENREMRRRLQSLEDKVRLQLISNTHLRKKLCRLGELDRLTSEKEDIDGILLETFDDSDDIRQTINLRDKDSTKSGVGGRQITEKNGNINKRQLQDVTIAFTAVISPPDLRGLTAGRSIVFDQVITNVGHAYDNKTGIFTAPLGGIYAFNMAVLVEPGYNEYLEFVKDGQHVMYNYAHAQGSLHDASSSRTTTLELFRGQTVWVRTSPNAAHGSGVLHGNGFTTFSGWLIAIKD